MNKIGCSNISIVLTLIGILPLVGSAFALFDIFFLSDSTIKISQLVTLIFLLIVGFISCSYRSCIYINNESLQVINSVLFHKISEKLYPVSQFDDIYIDTSYHDSYTDFSSGGYSYSIQFRGENKEINISDYLRIKRDVLKKPDWQYVKEFGSYLSGVTKLELNYSDKVKSINSMS